MLKHTLAGAALVALAVAPLTAQRRGTFLVPTPDQGTTRVAQRAANFLEERFHHVLRFALVQADLLEQQVRQLGLRQRHPRSSP